MRPLQLPLPIVLLFLSNGGSLQVHQPNSIGLLLFVLGVVLLWLRAGEKEK